MNNLRGRRFGRGSPHWRAEKKRRFLASLAMDLTQNDAATRAGVHWRTFYLWRDEDTTFAAMWHGVAERNPAMLRRLRHDAEDRNVGESLARLLAKYPPKERTPVYRRDAMLRSPAQEGNQ